VSENEEFDHERLSDAQDAFLTRLNRFGMLIDKAVQIDAGRNELLMPILPFLHPNHHHALKENSRMFYDTLEDIGEVAKLLGLDIAKLGDVVQDHMKYIDDLIENISED